MEFEEVRYGMLMMVLCDREGRVYDVWITFGKTGKFLEELAKDRALKSLRDLFGLQTVRVVLEILE